MQATQPQASNAFDKNMGRVLCLKEMNCEQLWCISSIQACVDCISKRIFITHINIFDYTITSCYCMVWE